MNTSSKKYATKSVEEVCKLIADCGIDPMPFHMSKIDGSKLLTLSDAQFERVILYIYAIYYRRAEEHVFAKTTQIGFTLQ